MQNELLKHFKVMLVTESSKLSAGELNLSVLDSGIVTDFVLSGSHHAALNVYKRETNAQTLFSFVEVSKSEIHDLVNKQIAHYGISYLTGFTFDIPRSKDSSILVPVTFIRGVTKAELQVIFDDILYSNRPIKDSKLISEIIRFYELDYNINEIKNNELRVLLFDVNRDRFNSGDDVVRYIVYTTTDSDLLIKSKEVLLSVKINASKVGASILNKHLLPLAQVYNRHRPILMSLKTGSKNETIKALINKIARMSKTDHKPIGMPKSKTFISDAVRDGAKYQYQNLDKFSLRDKFKILNLLDYKMQRSAEDIFVIRNGKTHYKQDRKIHSKFDLEMVLNRLLLSIDDDFRALGLYDKTIVLPKEIDYGLPVSRKQTLGHLPFGTTVTVNGNEISSGVYWTEKSGACDIDLSSIDRSGQRVGWGMYSGYDSKGTGITFSGDIVHPGPDGAMEFFTSSDMSYGLFANVYSGEDEPTIEILVGHRSTKNWIDETIIREEVKLASRGSIVGFVDDKKFTVFYGRMSNSSTSSAKDRVLLAKATAMNWTVKKLFDKFGIKYLEEIPKKEIDIDHDLSYSSFTIDKLEKLFGI